MPMLLDVPSWYGAGDRRVYRRQEDPPLDPEADNKRRQSRKKHHRKKKKEKQSSPPERGHTKKAHSPDHHHRHRRNPDKKQEHREHQQHQHHQQQQHQHQPHQHQQHQQQRKRPEREHKTLQKPQQKIEFAKEFKEHTDALFDSFPWKWDLGGSPSSSSTGSSEEEKIRGVPSVVFAVKDDLPSPLPENRQGHPLSPGTNTEAPTLPRTESATRGNYTTRPPPAPRLGGRLAPAHANRNLNPRRPQSQHQAIYDLTRLESASTYELEQQHQQNYILGGPRKDVGRESIALPRLTTPVQGVSYPPSRPVYGTTNTQSPALFNGDRLHAGGASHTSSITKGLETMRQNLRDKQAALSNAVNEFQSKRTLSASESASLADKLRQNCRRRDDANKEGQQATAGKRATINQKSEHYLSGIFNDLASKINFKSERANKEPYIPKVDGIITGQKSPESESLYLPNINPQRNTPVSATNLPFRPSLQNWSGKGGAGGGALRPMNIINVCGGFEAADLESRMFQEDVVDLTSQASSKYQNLIREERMRQESEERERQREMLSRQQQAARDLIDVNSMASSKFSKNTVKEVVCLEEDSHGIVRTRRTKKSFPRTIREEEIEIDFGQGPASKRGLFDGIWDIEPEWKEPDSFAGRIQPAKSNCGLRGPSHLLSGMKNSICQKSSKGSLEPPSGNQINIFAESPGRQSSTPYVSPKNAPRLPNSPAAARDNNGPSSPLWEHFVRPLNTPRPPNNSPVKRSDPRSFMYEQSPLVANAHKKQDAPSMSNSNSQQREPEGKTNIWTALSRRNSYEQARSPSQHRSPRYQAEEYRSPQSRQEEYHSPQSQQGGHRSPWLSPQSQEEEYQQQCRLVRPTPVRQQKPSSLKQHTSGQSVETRSVTFREDDSVDDPEEHYIPGVITAASSDGGAGLERGVPSSQRNGIRHNVHPWDQQAQQGGMQEYNNRQRLDLFNKANLRRHAPGGVGDSGGDGRRSMYDAVYGHDEAPFSPVIILDDEMDQVYEVLPADIPNHHSHSHNNRMAVDDLTDSMASSRQEGTIPHRSTMNPRQESDGESSIKDSEGTAQDSGESSNNNNNNNYSGAVTVTENRRFFGFLCT